MRKERGMSRKKRKGRIEKESNVKIIEAKKNGKYVHTSHRFKKKTNLFSHYTLLYHINNTIRVFSSHFGSRYDNQLVSNATLLQQLLFVLVMSLGVRLYIPIYLSCVFITVASSYIMWNTPLSHSELDRTLQIRDSIVT